jgi:hypothetical protein
VFSDFGPPYLKNTLAEPAHQRKQFANLYRKSNFELLVIEEVMDMNRISPSGLPGKLIMAASIASSLSGCPLTVNLNVATDKPIALNMTVDKPIDVKLDAGVAVTKLPPVRVTMGKKD